MDKKLNLLHLSSLAIWDLQKGKGRVSTYLPLKGMVERGHKLTFISSAPTVTTGEYHGIFIKKIWTPFRQKRALFQLFFIPIIDLCFIISGLITARKSKPDIVYAHCVYSALAAFIISKIYKAKFVIRLYGIGEANSNKWKHYPSFLLRMRSMKLKANAYILTNDGTGGDSFAKRYGVPENRIYFLKNGIDKDISLEPDKKLRLKYAPHEEKLLISVSRLTNSKKIDLIIKMMPNLIKLIPSKLIIIGDGEQMASLNQLVEELGLQESVIFLGALQQKEVYKYLNISDIFVSMNYLSSMSNPVFEAMLCRKPIVALNRGNTSDLIHNDVNGILVEPNEIGELPQKVYKILNNEIEIERLGNNAREFILEQFPTWEERVKKEIDIIENL